MHESECQLRQEDLLVAHKEAALDPSVNGHADVLSQVQNAFVVVWLLFSLLDSLEEESLERLERVLVHVVDNAQLDQQEVQSGTFGCDASVDLAEVVNCNFSLFSFDLLALNLSRGGFGHF